MDNDRVARIRARAHAIWEEEGRPDGREVEHWQRAVSEIEAEDAGRISETAGVSDGKPRRRRTAGSVVGELGETGAPTKAPSRVAQSTEEKPAKSGRRSGGKTASASRNAPVEAREGGVDPVPRRAGQASSSLAGGAKGLASRTAPTAAREGGVEPVPRGGGTSEAAGGETSAAASPPNKKEMRAAGTARRIINGLKPPTPKGRSRKPS